MTDHGEIVRYLDKVDKKKRLERLARKNKPRLVEGKTQIVVNRSANKYDTVTIAVAKPCA